MKNHVIRAIGSTVTERENGKEKVNCIRLSCRSFIRLLVNKFLPPFTTKTLDFTTAVVVK